jgi:hypothetical protein
MTPNKEKTVTVTQADDLTAAVLMKHIEHVCGPVSTEACENPGDDDRSILLHNVRIILARHREQAERDTIAGSAGEVLREAQFLCDRLDELDWSMTYEEYGRSYNGHVDPSHSRLKGALAALSTPGIDAGRLREALIPFGRAFVRCEEKNAATQSAPHKPHDFVLASAFEAAHQALSASPSDSGERMREIAQGFVDTLTDKGANRGTMLSIRHDELSALVTRARAALGGQP